MQKCIVELIRFCFQNSSKMFVHQCPLASEKTFDEGNHCPDDITEALREMYVTI